MPLAATAAAALALIGLGIAPAATAATAPPPLAVTKAAAFQRGGQVLVTWRNPKSTTFATVIVRYAQGNTAPAGPTKGIGVHLSAPKASSARLAGLAAATRYSVSIWTRNAAHRLSKPASIHFATRAPKPADATVSGTVTDTHGHPLAGVRVYVDDFSGLESHAATTDASGAYTLSASPGGAYLGFDGSVATGGDSDATGYQGANLQLKLGAGQARSGVDAQLPDGAAISGHVTDAVGNPLAGVTPSADPVDAYVQGGGFGVIEAVFFSGTTASSDSSGNYTLKGLPAYSVRVCLTTDNAVTGGNSDLAGYAGRCTGNVVITEAGHTTDAPDLALSGNAGGVVTGTVTGPSGHPLGNAFVSLSARASLFSTGAVTQPDGSFRLQAPAGRFQLCADPGASGSAGATTCNSALVAVHAGAVTTANVQLPRAGGIYGVVTGPNGKPVAWAGIEVESAGPAASGGGFATTDAHGRYLLTDLAAGSYSLCFLGGPPTAALPGGTAMRCPTSAYAVRAGAVRLGADARLSAGGAISGKITDDLGQPVRDSFLDVESSTDKNFGYGEIDYPDGRYTIFGLTTGSYLICLFAPDGPHCHGAPATRPYDGSPIRVTAGSVKTGINFTVPTGGSVSVTATDDHNRPLAGVDVAALAPCNPIDDQCDNLPLFGIDRSVTLGASEMTGPDGTVTLTDLAPGNYALCLFGYYAASRTHVAPTGYTDRCDTGYDVTVSAHATATASRSMADGGAMTGTITDTHGHALEGVQVLVSNAATTDYVFDSDFFGQGGVGGPEQDAVTDRDGHFTVHGVRPGDQKVCVDATLATGGLSKGGYLDGCVGGATPATATPVSVQADQTAPGVNLSLTSGAAITGTIKNRAGHVIDAVAVVFDAHGQLAAEAERGPGGGYRANRLPAGTYRVCFYPFGPYLPQCYNKVAWNGSQVVPKAAVKIALAAGAIRTGVNAALVHR
jgi:hypothetical protein